MTAPRILLLATVSAALVCGWMIGAGLYWQAALLATGLGIMAYARSKD